MKLTNPYLIFSQLKKQKSSDTIRLYSFQHTGTALSTQY